MNQALIDELDNLPQEYPGLEKLSDETVYLLGCGSFKQFGATLRLHLDPKRFCPFCLYEPERDLSKDMQLNNWWLRGNSFQKAATGHMSLIVPRRHLVDVSSMEPSDWAEIGLLFRFAENRFKLPGGGLMMRFGNPRYSAGTVRHLHINLISPESPEKEFRFPLSKGREDRIENHGRLTEHLKQLRDRGGVEWLLSPEGIAATPG